MTSHGRNSRGRGALVGFGSVLALVAVVLVAGCGGSGSSSTPAIGMPGSGAGSQGMVRSRVVLKIPAGRKTASKRSPAYVSAAAQGVIVYTSLTLATPSSGTAYDISSSSPLCSTTAPGGTTPDPSGARYCSLPITAPVGVDNITAVVYDLAPTGGSGGIGGSIDTVDANVLSRGTVQQTIAAFSYTTVLLTLNGTISSLVLSPASISVTTGQTYALTVYALDPDGYIIIGPGYYSSATQDQESIELEVCNAASGAVTLSTYELTAPGQTVTVTINADIPNATPAPYVTPGTPVSIMASVPDDGSVSSVAANLTQGSVNVNTTPQPYSLGALAVADEAGTLYVYAPGANVGTPNALVSYPFYSGLTSLAAYGSTIYGVSPNSPYVDEFSLTFSGNNPQINVFQFACSCTNPESVAVDTSGQVYVADNGSNAIDVYNPQSLPTPPPYVLSGAATELSNPVAVALDANNYLYVLNQNGNFGIYGGQAYVTVYAPGARGNTAPLEVPVLVGPIAAGGSMAISPAGQVVVAQYIDNAFQWLSIPIYPHFAAGYAAAIEPSSQSIFTEQQIAFDSYGNLLVVQVASPSIALLTPSLHVQFGAPAVGVSGVVSAVTSYTIPSGVPSSYRRRPASVGSGH